MGRKIRYGIAVMALFVLSTVIIWPYSFNYAEAEYIYAHTPETANPDMLAAIIILPDNKEDWNAAKGIIKRISSLPKYLLAKIESHGIRIRLFTNQLTDQPEAAHLKGVMPRGYTNTYWDDVPGMGGGRTVLVKVGSSERGKGHESANLELHELAHSVDSIILSDISHSAEFKAIWHTEVNQLFPNRQYFLDHPEEYFAEAFTLYFYQDETRNKLYEDAPLTYAFFRELELNKFESQ
ncbi:toxin [Pradoshia eiseniae]|uniref:Toxin n=1 Tax=Pradoshia eiseniae TaxID=2064768 RepID=A0A2S7N4U8_9BACI|nr:toxin [Pradoshia eiseniae]PQD96995.1 toxin [Pradoshia eiseniae]